MANTIKVTEELFTRKLILDFTIEQNGKVTISLFKGQSLVTEIIPAVVYKKGRHKVKWDKKDFLLQAVPADNYRFVLTVNNLKQTYIGRIGNNSKYQSYEGGKDYGYSNFTQDVAALNGYLYFANGVGEQHNGIYRTLLTDNKVRLDVYPNRSSLVARVCASSDRVYVLHTFENTHTHFITAVLPDAANTEVALPGSQAVAASGFYFGTYSYAVAVTQNNDSAYYRDIEVSSDNSRLLIAIPSQNKVQVWNLASNTLLKETTIESATRICRQTDSLYWIVSSGIARQYSLSSAGQLTATGKVFADLDTADDICCNASGSKLSVVITGATFQLKEINTSSLAEISTAGAAGGYGAGTLVTDNRLAFRAGFSGVCYDATGRWAVLYNHSKVAHFNTENTIDDYIQWFAGMYATARDEANPSRVFIGFLEFALDNTKDLNAPGAWYLKRDYTYRSPAKYTAESSKFVAISWVVTMPNGKTYAICKNSEAGTSELVELNDGILFRQALPYEHPSLYSHGLYYYKGPQGRDPGKTVAYCKRSITGYDSNGPVFGPEEIIFQKVVTSTDPFYAGGSYHGLGERIAPDEYLSFEETNGFQTFQSSGWKAGKFTKGATDFTWKTHYVTGAGYTGPFALDERFVNSFPITAAGSKFVAIKGIGIAHQSPEFYTVNNRGNQANIFKHFARNGQYLGWAGTYPTIEGYDKVGMAGNCFSWWAFEKNSDTVRIVQGTENVPYGMLVWDITGFNSIQIVETTFAVSNAPLLPDTYSIRLVDGIPPLLAEVPNGTDGWSRNPLTNQEANAPNGYAWVRSNEEYKQGSLKIQAQTNLSVSKQLNLKGKKYSSWMFRCLLTILDYNPAGDGILGINIKDAAGQLITQFRTNKAPGVSDPIRGYFNLNLNNKTVYSVPSGFDKSPMRFSKVQLINPHDFYIVCAAGVITCGFAGLAPVISLATGDYTSPSLIELFVSSPPKGNGQSLSITDAEFILSPVNTNLNSKQPTY